ncbi:MAG: 50S ribosomal protein L18, partial [Gammaproteobacteria bacterium]
MNKKIERLRRAKKARGRIQDKNAIRLCVHKTPRHVYAQVIAANGAEVLASAST